MRVDFEIVSHKTSMILHWFWANRSHHLEGMLIFTWHVLAGMDYWTGLPKELWCSTQRCYCNIGLYLVCSSHVWMLSIYFHKIHQNLSFKGLFIKMFFQGSIPLDPAWQLCWSGHISSLTSQKKKKVQAQDFFLLSPLWYYHKQIKLGLSNDFFFFTVFKFYFKSTPIEVKWDNQMEWHIVIYTK